MNILGTRLGNSAISSFTLHNITPLITFETQYKFYDEGGGTNNKTQLEREIILPPPWMTSKSWCFEIEKVAALYS